MSIGENIRGLRKRVGLTQGQLADKANVQLTQISRLENDDTDPKASTLLKIMNALNCSADNLLMDSQKEQPYYIKRTVEKINELTPLRQFVLLDIIESYCKQWEVPEPNLNSWNGRGLTEHDAEQMAFEAYSEQLLDDDKAVDEISHEIHELREAKRI